MFSINLINNIHNPVFWLGTGIGTDIRVMLDTGVGISIFDDTICDIRKIFPDAHRTGHRAVVPSVNDISYSDNVWFIPKFKLGNVTYIDFPVLCGSLYKYKVSMLLSGEMFNEGGLLLSRKENLLIIGGDINEIDCSLIYPDSNARYIDYVAYKKRI